MEKFLNPNSGELITNGYDVQATIYDAELDPISCTFDGENVVIDCQDLEYITFDKTNLQQLIKLLNQANKYLSKY